ncbi:MAG: HAMP domain-containing protein [Leptolinea sp.]|nr:HAMP domain-containing protein [Leptolinea sp.]
MKKMNNGSGIRFRDSLRTQFLFYFLVLAVIPLIVIGVVSIIQSQNALLSRIKNDLRVQTELQGTMLNTFLEERKDNMIVLASTTRVRTMDPDNVVAALDQYYKQWGVYENLNLYGLDGGTVYRTDKSSINVADRSYHKNALKGETTISDPVVSKASGNIVFVVGTPVWNEGKVVGVVTGSIPTTEFKDFINAEDLVGGDGFLINKDGFLITPSNHTETLLEEGLLETRSELELKPDTLAVNSILEGKSGVEEYTDTMGKSVIGAFFPVEGTSWGLVMEHSTDVVLSDVFNLRNLLIVIILLAAIIVIFLSILISNYITMPILKISTLSQKIARGEMPEETITHNRKDEINLLATSFQNIVEYFSQIAQVSSRLADGDLSVDITAHSEDDVLGNSFGEMIKRLRTMIQNLIAHITELDTASIELAQTALEVDGVTTQIATTIQQVAKGTTQQTESITRTASNVEDFSHAVADVAGGAQEQAVALEKASDAMEKLSNVIKQVSGNANAVAQGSAAAKKAADNGSKTVQSTLEEMRLIKESVGISSQKVQEMGERSDQIGTILTTIEDIASQTNMLALNAAIEAARAGETGKGFAVVADEVRKLAERVSMSTQEIDGLIKGIQKSMTEANNAMSEGTNEVDKGVELANQAGIALEEILNAADTVNIQAEQEAAAVSTMTEFANDLVNNVDAVSSVVERNTAATEEMAASTNEVTHAVENIASISEENSAAAQEVSASTEEMAARVEEVSTAAHRLSELSQQLRAMVSQFKTE